MKVLVIYQGEEANKDSKPYISHIIDHCNTLNDVNIDRLDDKDSSFDIKIYNKFLEKVNDCQAAIALITYDDRKASSAGNVWFELGIWCGMKSTQNLLVLVNKKVEKPPSDILGQMHTQFDSFAEMDEPISRFIEKVQKILTNANYQAIEYEKANKVRDIFLPKFSPQDVTETLFYCRHNNNHCPNKEELYSFGSELMRMHCAYWEHYCIQHYLLKIAYYIEMMVMHDFERNRKLKKQYAEKVKHTVSSLNIFSNDYLTVRVRIYPQKDPLAIKLMHFLNYRLGIAEEMGEEFLELPSPTLPTLKGRLSNFINWMSQDVLGPGDFVENVIKPKPHFKSSDELCISDYGEFSLNMAEVLKMLGKRTYKKCSTLFENEFDEIDHVKFHLNSIKNINEKLPHNNQNEVSVKIWPRK